MAEEEAILKTRVAFAESNKLLRPCLKRLQQLYQFDSLDASDQTLQALLTDLEAFDNYVGRNNLVNDANQREREAYHTLHEQIEHSIGQVQRDIDNLKVQLEQERVTRRHKEDYEAMEKVINELPSRAHTERQIRHINRELESLTRDNSIVGAKLDLRAKQFKLLLQTIADLQRTMDDDVMWQQIRSQIQSQAQPLQQSTPLLSSASAAASPPAASPPSGGTDVPMIDIS